MGRTDKLMKTFTLNGKVYEAKELDFNMICDLEAKGLSLEEIESKPMSMMREYVAFCMGVDEKVAGKEIEGHMISGGNFGDIASVMSGAMEDSGFFQALSKGTETETPKSKAKTKKVVAITEA